MLSRALSLATVTLLVGYLTPIPVQAQNLEAGKSPSQIFAGTCSLCHKSARGLLKTVPAASLPGFLREHYTTSGDMASLLSAFLISNGATNTRYGGNQPPDAKPEAKPAGLSEQLDWQGRRLPGPAPRQDGAGPDDDGSSPLAPRQGRNARRPAAPGEVPDTANLSERDPDGRKPAGKQKLGKKNKPGGEELPKTDALKLESAKPEPSNGEAAKAEQPKNEAAGDEGSKPEAAKIESTKTESAKPESAKTESAKTESAKTESPKLPAEDKSEAAKTDLSKEIGSTQAPRVDPAPQVTPPPPPVAASGPASASTVPSAQSATPAVAASAPPPAPLTPAGPPVPPISQ